MNVDNVDAEVDLVTAVGPVRGKFEPASSWRHDRLPSVQITQSDDLIWMTPSFWTIGARLLRAILTWTLESSQSDDNDQAIRFFLTIHHGMDSSLRSFNLHILFHASTGCWVWPCSTWIQDYLAVQHTVSISYVSNHLRQANTKVKTPFITSVMMQSTLYRNESTGLLSFISQGYDGFRLDSFAMLLSIRWSVHNEVLQAMI